MTDMTAHNLAYDYSAYDESERIEEEEQEKKNSAELAGRSHKTTSIIKVLAIAVAVMAILFAMIYGRVELTSLYSKQSELETELSRLQNENVSLESELAKKTGLTKIEDYAENRLGLRKLNRAQIEYVEVPKASVAQAAEVEDDNLFVAVKRWFTGVLEYIGAQ